MCGDVGRMQRITEHWIRLRAIQVVVKTSSTGLAAALNSRFGTPNGDEFGGEVG